jgi:hypothetical protein
MLLKYVRVYNGSSMALFVESNMLYITVQYLFL